MDCWAGGTKRWRSTLPSAARTAGDMPFRPVSRWVSAYIASTSATMRLRSAEKSWASVVPMPSRNASSAGAPRSSAPLVFLDQRVGAVVVDRLEVLRLDHVGVDALIEVQDRGHVAHQVLDELGIVVGALGDELLVRALQQAIELAR